jgi:hypothetical protein
VAIGSGYGLDGGEVAVPALVRATYCPVQAVPTASVAHRASSYALGIRDKAAVA